MARVRGRIAAAAERSGRAAGDVTLVAVTKFVPADVVRLLVEAGCRELGESRPQELWEKAAALADLPIRWHLIGHLQRNKVAADAAAGGDDPFDRQPAAAGRRGGRIAGNIAMRRLPVLLEVNVSGEAAKHGFRPRRSSRCWPNWPAIGSVAVRGLMCMAALEGGPDVARRDFAALRELRDRLRHRCPPGHTLDELSMGMSGDFEQAIEEGATIVRVGSALFEGIVGSG